jgi:hypothetical protein
VLWLFGAVLLESTWLKSEVIVNDKLIL